MLTIVPPIRTSYAETISVHRDRLERAWETWSLCDHQDELAEMGLWNRIMAASRELDAVVLLAQREAMGTSTTPGLKPGACS